MREHCAHARFVWNLAVEQQSWWKRGRKSAPGYLEQCRQLTAARRENDWLRAGSQRRLVLLQRKLARARPRSRRRARVRLAIARLKAREADCRKDWCEKLSTGLARRFDLIRVEDLRIASMTRSARGTVAEPGRNVRQKTGLNREIARSGWGQLVTRLEQKAPGRVQKISPACTSQRCSACGYTTAGSRESQSRFRCVACNFACNADVNAALNIAAGHAAKARGGDRVTGPAKREPQHAGLLVA
jgi:transposase